MATPLIPHGNLTLNAMSTWLCTFSLSLSLSLSLLLSLSPSLSLSLIRVLDRGWPPASRASPTFEHLDGHGDRLLGLVLVDAQRLGHDHLAEAALAQRLAQRQPITEGKTHRHTHTHTHHQQG